MTQSAIILSAGLGLRMRPLTNTVPKPLIKVAGKTMLERAFDHLEINKISKIIVNTHYLPKMITEVVKNKALISHEEILLETGGGIQNALPLLGNEAFFSLNGDCVWTGSESITAMNHVWNEETMDGLLLLIPRERAHGYEGAGDFFLSSTGQLSRRGEAIDAPYVFTGVQLLSPRLFLDAPGGVYSMNILYNKAIASGRLYGHVHTGEWFHISTPEDLKTYDPVVAEIEGR